MAITINGTEVAPPDDVRVSLLDLLRERLHLTGTKICLLYTSPSPRDS